VKSTVAWRKLESSWVFTILFPTLELELTDRFAGDDPQGRNERAVKGMRYPTLYYRVLVYLRLLVPAVRVLDQRKWSRFEEFEQSGYYRAGAPRYFF
jgi:hypothetical protein